MSSKLGVKKKSVPDSERDFCQELDLDKDLRDTVAQIKDIALTKVNQRGAWTFETKQKHRKACLKAMQIVSNYVCKLMEKDFGFRRDEYSLLPSLSSSIETFGNETQRFLYPDPEDPHGPNGCPKDGDLAIVAHASVKRFWKKINSLANVALHDLVQERRWNLKMKGKKIDIRLPLIISPDKPQGVRSWIQFSSPMDVTQFNRIAQELPKLLFSNIHLNENTYLQFRNYLLWPIIYQRIGLTNELRNNLVEDKFLGKILEKSDLQKFNDLITNPKNLHFCLIPISDEPTGFPLGSVAILTGTRPLTFREAKSINDFYYHVFNAINKVELSAHWVGTIEAVTRSVILHDLSREWEDINSLNVSESEKNTLKKDALDLELLLLTNNLNKSPQETTIEWKTIESWAMTRLKRCNNFTPEGKIPEKINAEVALWIREVLRNANKSLKKGSDIASFINLSIEHSGDSLEFECRSFPHEKAKIDEFMESLNRGTQPMEILGESGNGLRLISTLAEIRNYNVIRSYEMIDQDYTAIIKFVPKES